MDPRVLSIDGHIKNHLARSRILRVLYVQESDQYKVMCRRLGYFCSMAFTGITIHGKEGSDFNRKASRSVLEMSIEPIFNLFLVKNL